MKMRSVRLLISGLALFWLAPQVQAQFLSGRLSLGGFGTVGIPLWKDDPLVFMDDFAPGLGFGGEIGLAITGSTQLVVRLTYQTFRPDTDGMKEELAPQFGPDGTLNKTKGVMPIGMVSTHLRQHIGWGGLYLTAGGGYALYKSGEIRLLAERNGFEFEEPVPRDTENGFFACSGLGFSSALSWRVSLFTEVNFYYVFKDNPNNVFLLFFAGGRILL